MEQASQQSLLVIPFGECLVVKGRPFSNDLSEEIRRSDSIISVPGCCDTVVGDHPF